MNSDPLSIEGNLREFAAAPLDDDFLMRLEACAEGTDLQLTVEESRMESKLRRIAPAPLGEMMSELEVIFRDVPFARDEKIVYFPKAGAVQPVKQRRPLWAAAAAVALIGGATAFLIPNSARPIGGEVVNALPDPAPLVAKIRPGDFVPDSFNRGVSEVKDEGIVWKSKDQAHSVVRVTYQDRITLKDDNGRTIQAEQPRVQYMLVPAKTD